MFQKKYTYFEKLTGLRAIAAFSVIFAHLSYWINPDTKFFTVFKYTILIDNLGGRMGVIFFLYSNNTRQFIDYNYNKSHK